MENIILKIYNHLGSAIEKAKSEKNKIKTFDKNHIFFDILKHLSKNIGVGEKVAMFYHFNCYQKSLDEARNNNANMSKFWIEYVDKMETEFSPHVKKGMDALYYPMIAYYHFVDKKYDQAISDLKTSIKLLTEMEHSGIEVMLWAKTEQILNIGRSQLICEDYDKMNATITDLLLFLACGKPSEFLDDVSRKILEEEDVVERLSTIDYVLDSILGKILFSKNKDKENQYQKAFKLLSPLRTCNDMENCPIVGFRESIDLVKFIEFGNQVEFLNGLNNLLPNLIYIPKQLQYLIFEEFKEVSRLCLTENQIELLEKNLNDYYKNELGLHLGLKKINFDKSLEAVKSVIK